MVNMSSIKISSGLLLLFLFASILPELTLSKKFCGAALDEVLSVVCDGVYNKIMKKSTDMSEIDNDLAEDLPFPFPYGNTPFLSRMHAGGSILAKTRRRRHGVYDECCRKGCTYQELMSFCAF